MTHFHFESTHSIVGAPDAEGEPDGGAQFEASRAKEDLLACARFVPVEPSEEEDGPAALANKETEASVEDDGHEASSRLVVQYGPSEGEHDHGPFE